MKGTRAGATETKSILEALVSGGVISITIEGSVEH